VTKQKRKIPCRPGGTVRHTRSYDVQSGLWSSPEVG